MILPTLRNILRLNLAILLKIDAFRQVNRYYRPADFLLREAGPAIMLDIFDIQMKAVCGFSNMYIIMKRNKF